MPATVTLTIFPRSRKDGKYPVCIRVTKGRQIAYRYLCYVKPNHWNDTSKIIHTYEPKHYEFNTLLRKAHREVRELVDVYEENNWAFTARDILAINYDNWKSQQAANQSKPKPAVPDGLLAFITDTVMPHWKDRGMYKNAEKYEIEHKLLAEWIFSLRPQRSDLAMSSLTPELVGKWFTWLRNRKHHAVRKDSTLKRHLAQLQAVLVLARDKGVIAALPNTKVELDVRKSKKAKLGSTDIQQMADYQWPESLSVGGVTERRSVQTFLLQYYFYGARVADIMLLKNSNVIARHGKLLRIEYYQKKGRKGEGKRLMTIPITAATEPIIREYWVSGAPAAYLLPWLKWEHSITATAEENYLALEKDIGRATVVMNMALKRASARIGLEAPPFSSHSARHSFAQRAKQKGTSIEFIKESLGHSNYNITEGYLADLDPEELNEHLQGVYD